jgi:hypothetical protein
MIAHDQVALMLDELEARHDAVIEQLDDLNDRLESLLREHGQMLRCGEAPPEKAAA